MNCEEKISTFTKMAIKFVAQTLRVKGSAVNNYARTIGVSLSPVQTVLFGDPKYVIGFVVTFCHIKIRAGKNADLTSSTVW